MDGWVRAMGVYMCSWVGRYERRQTKTRKSIDPVTGKVWESLQKRMRNMVRWAGPWL